MYCCLYYLPSYLQVAIPYYRGFSFQPAIWDYGGSICELLLSPIIAVSLFNTDSVIRRRFNWAKVAIPYYRGFSFQRLVLYLLIGYFVSCYPLLSRVLFSTDVQQPKPVEQVEQVEQLLSPIIAGSLFNCYVVVLAFQNTFRCYPLLSRGNYSASPKPVG